MYLDRKSWPFGYLSNICTLDIDCMVENQETIVILMVYTRYELEEETYYSWR